MITSSNRIIQTIAGFNWYEDGNRTNSFDKAWKQRKFQKKSHCEIRPFVMMQSMELQFRSRAFCSCSPSVNSLDILEYWDCLNRLVCRFSSPVIVERRNFWRKRSGIRRYRPYEAALVLQPILCLRHHSSWSTMLVRRYQPTIPFCKVGRFHQLFSRRTSICAPLPTLPERPTVVRSVCRLRHNTFRQAHRQECSLFRRTSPILRFQ